MTRVLWVAQIALAAFFLFTGVQHYVVPEGLPDQMAWMYDLSQGQHYLIGTLEILGAIGLVLPGLARIAVWLTTLAGAGLAVVMIGAAVWHLQRGEYQNVVLNLVIGSVAALVALGRWRRWPISPAE